MSWSGEDRCEFLGRLWPEHDYPEEGINYGICQQCGHERGGEEDIKPSPTTYVSFHLPDVSESD